jgi:hypothetical protein
VAASAKSKPRLARKVIDDAIKENRCAEFFCYGLIVIFVGVGLLVIGIGVYNGSGLVSIAGSVAAALFWPALKHAVAIRQTNMSVRLLEVPLEKASTAGEAAIAIKNAFVSKFGKGSSDVAPPT